LRSNFSVQFVKKGSIIIVAVVVGLCLLSTLPRLPLLCNLPLPSRRYRCSVACSFHCRCDVAVAVALLLAIAVAPLLIMQTK